MQLRRKPLRIRNVVSALRRMPVISFTTLWREVEQASSVCYFVKGREETRSDSEPPTKPSSSGTLVHFPRQ